MQIKNRIKGLAQLHHSKIQPCPKNWRTHGDRQRDVLRGLLADVGVVDAVLVRPLGEAGLRALRQVKRGDAAGFAKWLASFPGPFMLVDGHLRVEELQQHGDGTIDVLVLDLDEREAAEVLALFDPIGDLAGMDAALFQANLADFNSTNPAVMAMCADLSKVEQRMREEVERQGGAGEAPEPDDDGGAAERAAAKERLAAEMSAADDGPEVNPTDELRAKWKTERGQLWEIESADGTRVHRLLCGDSTSAEDVRRLMGSRRARIMQTDAPYGVDYSKTKNGIPVTGFQNHTERWGDIENDGLVDGPALQAFLEKMIRAALPHMEADAAYYFWHPMLTQGTFFAAAAAAADILIHRQIIWVKRQMVLTRSGMYHWKHELCFYGWVRGNKPPWHGDKGQTSVWEIGRDDDSGMHPTQKPVAIWIPPLNNHTQTGDVAFEPFSGSGGQILACEQLGRICCAMELEPKYVAVGLERAHHRGMTVRLKEPSPPVTP